MFARLYAWLRSHPTVVDVAIATIPPGLDLIFQHSLADLSYALLICVPLVWRRRRPAAVLLVVFGLGALQLALGPQARTFDLAVVFAIYSAAAYGPRWSARLALWGGMAGATLATLRWMPQRLTDWLITLALVLAPVVVAWTVGDNLRIRRAYLAELEERAVRLERERDQEARIAVAAERARIARELHDVVAHSVSVMVVQADGAACALAEADLPEAGTAIDAISRTGRGALRELRLLLGVLREASGEREYGPQPDVSRIAQLTQDVPLPVELRVRGTPRQPSQGVGLAAYRIVQEALTNTLKHAGSGARASVEVRYGDEGMEIVVDDDGHGPLPGGDPGHGLVGMRERAALFGGTLQAGARPGGGFRVTARLPWNR